LTIELAASPHAVTASSPAVEIGAPILGRTLQTAARHVDRIFGRLFRSLGLTQEQWSILMSLREQSVATAVDVARDHGFDTGSLRRSIDILVWRGLLARERSRDDRRVVLLSLTPAGDDLLSKITPDIVAAWNSLLSDLDAPEIQSLISLLRRLT